MHHDKMKKLVFLSALSIICFTISSAELNFPFTVSAANAEEYREIELRLQRMPSPIDVSVEAQVMREIARRFTAENPQYSLQSFEFPELEGMGMDQGPLMSIATGVPPHGIYVNFRQSGTYINHGFLVPLEILLARLKSDNPETREYDENDNWLANPTEGEIRHAREKLKGRIIEPALPVVYRESYRSHLEGIPEGKWIWALPFNNLVRALVWRRDVFARSGLPMRAPRDWEELMEFSRRIREHDPDQYGIMFSWGDDVSWQIYSFMVSQGIEYLERDEEGRWRAAFNTPEAAEAIYYVLRLVRESWETEEGEELTGAAYAPFGGGPEMAMMWEQGEIGMQFEYLSYDRAMDLNPAIEGVAPAPESPKGIPAGELNCSMLGVFADAPPRKQLGTMKWIWELTGEEAEDLRTRRFVDAGYGEFLNPEVLERLGYTDVLARVTDEWIETTETAFREGVPEPYGRDTQLIYRYVDEPINWALQNPALLDFPEEEALAMIERELDIAAERVDEHLLGEIDEDEERRRNIVGGMMFFLVIIIFVFTIGRVWRAFTYQDKMLGDRPPLRKFKYAYLLLVPALGFMVFVRYIPEVLGIPLALFDFELAIESRFVGLSNFATILYDPRFWASVARTFYYALLVVGLGFWPPIMVAILLDEVPTAPLKYFFRTIFYLPTIVSGIIMVFIWRQFYDSTESGVLNQIIMSVNGLGPVTATIVRFIMIVFWLSLIVYIFSCVVKLEELSWLVRGAIAAFGTGLLIATLWPLVNAYLGPDELVIMAQELDPAEVSGWSAVVSYLSGFIGSFDIEPLRWIEDPGLAMICVVIPMVWSTAGPGCIIYLAALKTVPEDLIEAAAIDGAGIIQRISYITLPRIKFLILIQLLGAVIGAFKGGVNMIMVLTGGGPSDATQTIGVDIFRRAWMELGFSTGAAMGLVLGAIVIMLSGYQLKRMSRATFKTAGQVQENE